MKADKYELSYLYSLRGIFKLFLIDLDDLPEYTLPLLILNSFPTSIPLWAQKMNLQGNQKKVFDLTMTKGVIRRRYLILQ
jgi:hypothetical protein